MDAARPFAEPPPRRVRVRVRVRGVVQGVGFRPHVWRLARDLGLVGWVRNDDEGVIAEVQGAAVDAFLERLTGEAPPLARIDAVEHAALAIDVRAADFTIIASARGTGGATRVSPDVATCPACLEELFDPANRRYRHPFINCTDCGPRLTIVRATPYDRANTAMAGFAMCPTCQGEYDDPADRRFHAQPNACPDCGPTLSASIEDIVADLQAGAIVALKGIGGFHLVCDARDADAVDRLRARKARDAKPFAVMVAGRAGADAVAHVTGVEAKALADPACPIVVCRARSGSGLAAGVSNGLGSIGVMRAYSPIHALLFHEWAGRPNGTAWMDALEAPALVMTSANVSGAPLITDAAEDGETLRALADRVVDHDRAIVAPCEDSVVRVIGGAPAYLRRARGAAPDPIALPRAVPPTLAFGAHLKTTVCVTRGDEAYVSPHIGDVDDPRTRAALHDTARRLCAFLDVAPERVACDLHPDFASSQMAATWGAPLARVQHHHAHIAAVAAEHGVEGPLIGLALDGYGYGLDAGAWGGELLRVDGARMTRLAGLAPLPQPGGDRAAREPWRMGAAALWRMGRGDDIAARFADQAGAAVVAAMLDKGVNTPSTSSAGRLFDAACGLLGVVPVAGFEGQAPMVLEGLVGSARALVNGWRIDEAGRLDMTATLAALLDAGPVEGAELFHGAFAAGLAAWAAQAVERDGARRFVALSGGCAQNAVLVEALRDALGAQDIALMTPRQAPANDGGLSLGQAWVAGLMDEADLERERDDVLGAAS